MVAIKTIEKGFNLIERAAIKGERAPTNVSMDNPNGQLHSGVTSQLLKQGKIRVEVYAHNWRVIEILTGPNAGKRTAMPPYKYATKPYLTLPRVNA